MENGLSLNNSTVHQVLDQMLAMILNIITTNIVAIIFVIVVIIVVIKLIVMILVMLTSMIIKMMVTITTIIMIIIAQGEDDGEARRSRSQMYSFTLQLVDVSFSFHYTLHCWIYKISHWQVHIVGC